MCCCILIQVLITCTIQLISALTCILNIYSGQLDLVLYLVIGAWTWCGLLFSLNIKHGHRLLLCVRPLLESLVFQQAIGCSKQLKRSQLQKMEPLLLKLSAFM